MIWYTWIFIGRTDTEAEVPILWQFDAKSQLIGKDPNAMKDWGSRRRGQQRLRWLDHQLDGHESEQTPGDSEGQGSLACCSPQGHKNMTEWLNSKERGRVLWGRPLCIIGMLPLLLLSRFSCAQLCATAQMAAHQAPRSLGFSRQEYWNASPLPSPMIRITKQKQ